VTKGGFFAAALTAGAALLVLVLAGFAFVLLSAIYAGVAAVVAAVVLMVIASMSGWSVAEDGIGFIGPFVLAFLISGGVGLALDLILKTHFSVPGMGAALDLTHWVNARPQPLIRTVPDYYAFALGPKPSTWLRFIGFQVAIVLVFAAVLIRIPAEPELEPDPPMTRVLRLVALSAIAVATSAVTVFPLAMWAMIALRDRSPFGAP
jgi:hypothetical protein